ncbi:MAG: 16S rRNA (uracil(1498)-N(3))-methyltransferase [Henriciella sp.]|nr:16S rRNA (uracil(1498)-N(3))-methyltransferase [Henriciella sp.]
MSHIARIYVTDALNKNEDFALPDAQSKYLIRVMRLVDGAIVRAFNGRDGEWQCVLRVNGKIAVLEPQDQTRPQSAGPDLTLLFAPIKKARTDFIVEKATELGVRHIRPVLTEYTQSQRVRTDRMRLLTIEAAEQTERMDLPEIYEAETLPKMLAKWDQNTPLIYCDEGADAAPMRELQSQLSDRPAGLLIGPEGGFSPREREILRSLDYVLPITLGPRILRAETAVVSALTLWQSQVGDWQKAPYLPQT